MDRALQLCKYVIQFADEAVATEIQLLQFPQASETPRQCTTQAIAGVIEMPQVAQFGEFGRNGAGEPVVGQIQVLQGSKRPQRTGQDPFQFVAGQGQVLKHGHRCERRQAGVAHKPNAIERYGKNLAAVALHAMPIDGAAVGIRRTGRVPWSGLAAGRVLPDAPAELQQRFHVRASHCGGAGCGRSARAPAVIADAAAAHGRSGRCRRRRSSRGPVALGMDWMQADLAIPRGPRLSVEEKERETRGRKKRQIHVSSLLLLSILLLLL